MLPKTAFHAPFDSPQTEATSNIAIVRLLVSAADNIYVLIIARRPHTGATSQQTDLACLLIIFKLLS